MRNVLKSVAITASLLVPSFSVYASSYQEQINDLNKTIKEHEEKKEAISSQLSSVKQDVKSLQTQIDALAAQMAKTENDISFTSNKINETKKRIIEKSNEIARTEADLEEKKVLLANNLRIMYMKGDVSYFEFLFRSESMSDFLYRFSSLQDVAHVNKQIYEEVKALHEKLMVEKTDLQKEEKALEETKKELENMRSSLSASKVKIMELLKARALEESRLSHELHEEDEQGSALNAQLAAAIRKREEEKRQQALQQQQNNNNGQTKPPNQNQGSVSFRSPMNSGTYFISSTYGWRTHPVTGGQKLHNGVDFAAPTGANMYAVADGYVLLAGPARGYGNWIVIEHDNGMYSIYGHMYSHQLYVHSGQRVSKGQHIADVGSAGTSTGSHLHYSLASGFNGNTFTYVNPANYIPY